jgi:hypothetical protein
MDQRVAQDILRAYPGRKMTVADARTVIRAWARQWPEDRWGNFKPADDRRIKLTKRQIRREEKRGRAWRSIRSTPMVDAALNLVKKAATELGDEVVLAKVGLYKVKRAAATEKRADKSKQERLHKEVMDMVAKVASAEMPDSFAQLHDEGVAGGEFQARYNELVKRVQTLRRIGSPPRDQDMFSTFEPPLAPVLMDVSAEWVEEIDGVPYTITIRHGGPNVAAIEIGAPPGLARVDPIKRFVSESLIGFGREGDSYISGRIHRSAEGPYGALYFIASKEKQRGAGSRVLDLWCNLMDSYGVQAWVAEAVGDEGMAFLDAKVRQGRLEKVGGEGANIVMRCLGGYQGRQPRLPGVPLTPNTEEEGKERGRYDWEAEKAYQEWINESLRNHYPAPPVAPDDEPNPLYWLWKRYSSSSPSGRRRFHMDEWYARKYATRAYAWAVPSPSVIQSIASWGPILEVGAGRGYWAKLIADAGVDIIATDPYSPEDAFYPIEKLTDVEAVKKYGAGRTLLLIWPPYDMSVAFNALRAFEEVGGRRLIYIGEGVGGCTGDDPFHEAAGLGTSWRHDEGDPVADNRGWEVTGTEHDLPNWDGIHDSVYFIERHGGLANNPKTVGPHEETLFGGRFHVFMYEDSSGHHFTITDDTTGAKYSGTDRNHERAMASARKWAMGRFNRPVDRNGDVMAFPERPDRITIGSRTYAVSDVGVPIVGAFAEGPETEAPSARVIDAGGNAWRYVWVHEPGSNRLEMYRHSDGEWKVLGSPSEYPMTFKRLRESGQLNEVTPEELVEFEVEMRKRNDETLASLQEWWEEEKSDEQRRVDVLVQRFFDERVRPAVQHGFDDVDRGVFPFNFEYREGIPKSREHQAKTHILGTTLGREGFYSPYGSDLERYVLRGLGKGDVEELEDMQAIQWSATDLAHSAYQKLAL